ncbi:MAG TPA: RDD family protein [Candidatus Acidoferrales bacterium]|nr:RDD family protein [Candidatus Acidoferrales bacterium]
MIAPPQYSPDGRWWWNGATWLPAPPSPVGSFPQPWGALRSVRYAGFWIRLVAYLVDAVLLNVVAIPLNLVAFGNSGFVCASTNYTVITSGISIRAVNYSCSPTGAGYLIYFVLGLLYFTFMWSTGATLGQRLLRIRVVDAATNEPLSLGRSLARYFGFVISAIPLAIGLIWAAFEPRKRGWHDHMAGSLVLRGKQQPPSTDAAG